ncbi:hypothetical protein [Paenibacillus sp. FSL R7-0333]|uniref:hypothetical protein n=1 Tax=Paenibacillus sp. FSL R7-0333 TaxID=1926587 RepID=UPI00096D723E|nr:hypothetical protein BK146_27300 [Paenibacillus sp. FSL R7-0333]
MNPMYPYYDDKTVSHVQPVAFPPQHQDRQPGLESVMQLAPSEEQPSTKGAIVSRSGMDAADSRQLLCGGGQCLRY